MALLPTVAIAEPRVGIGGDVGVPDGAQASLAMRWSAVTFYAGTGHNGVTRGLRAGIELAPASWFVRPTLSADYGRFPEGDANPFARMVSRDPMFYSASLERVGYDYANGHLGIEIGRRLVFSLRGGVSHITGALHGLAAGSEAITFTRDPKATVWSVSARMGVTLYVN